MIIWISDEKKSTGKKPIEWRNETCRRIVRAFEWSTLCKVCSGSYFLLGSGLNWGLGIYMRGHDSMYWKKTTSDEFGRHKTNKGNHFPFIYLATHEQLLIASLLNSLLYLLSLAISCLYKFIYCSKDHTAISLPPIAPSRSSYPSPFRQIRLVLLTLRED